MKVNNISLKQKIAVGMFLILLITNPNRSSFGSYLHQSGYKGIGRDFNGLIFSVYSDKNYNHRSDETVKTYYIGILGNFFKSPF